MSFLFRASHGFPTTSWAIRNILNSLKTGAPVLLQIPLNNEALQHSIKSVDSETRGKSFIFPDGPSNVANKDHIQDFLARLGQANLQLVYDEFDYTFSSTSKLAGYFLGWLPFSNDVDTSARKEICLAIATSYASKSLGGSSFLTVHLSSLIIRGTKS